MTRAHSNCETMNDSAALLEVKSVSCERDDRLLYEDLSFAVNYGDVLQVEGPNGAGKTTLLRMISGLMPVHQGGIWWKGQPLAEQRQDFLQNLLFLGHKTGIKGIFTPFENLQFWAANRMRVSGQELLTCLDKAGLAGFEHTPCHSLSAGQQRRAALARLHLSRAEFWVLDEAFTAIDKNGVTELELWIEQKAAAGGAVMLTTHHKLATRARFRSLTLGNGSP